MARAKLLQYNDLISTFCWFDKGGLSLAYADTTMKTVLYQTYSY